MIEDQTREPINIDPRIRDALRNHLNTKYAGTGVGYSEFIRRAIEADGGAVPVKVQPDNRYSATWQDPNASIRRRLGLDHGDWFIGSGVCKTCRLPWPCAGLYEPVDHIPPHQAERPADYPTREQLDPVWAGYMGRPVAAHDELDEDGLWPKDPPFCVACGKEMLTVGNLEIEGRPEWHAEEDLNVHSQ